MHASPCPSSFHDEPEGQPSSPGTRPQQLQGSTVTWSSTQLTPTGDRAPARSEPWTPTMPAARAPHHRYALPPRKHMSATQQPCRTPVSKAGGASRERGRQGHRAGLCGPRVLSDLHKGCPDAAALCYITMEAGHPEARGERAPTRGSRRRTPAQAGQLSRLQRTET